MAQQKSFFPTLKQNITKTSSGSNVVSYSTDVGTNGPILTLIHGYPQSAFEWRYMVPLLESNVSLFVPELPGYGVSSPQDENSKRAIGASLIEAMQKVFNITGTKSRKVVLGGHDRGARIVHRLAVDKEEFTSIEVIGAVMLDIVPTKVQWDNFADPLISSGYYHWPLLANVEISMAMIKGYGPRRWVTGAHTRLSGSNKDGQQRIFANDAVEVYGDNFEKEETLRYSAEDYKTGAGVDVQEQADDQKAGRKIEVPTLVMFSKEKLGSRQNVEAIWRDWIQSGVSYKAIGVGEGHGHYLPEEGPEIVAEAVLGFLKEIA